MTTATSKAPRFCRLTWASALNVAARDREDLRSTAADVLTISRKARSWTREEGVQ